MAHCHQIKNYMFTPTYIYHGHRYKNRNLKLIHKRDFREIIIINIIIIIVVVVVVIIPAH